MTRQQDNKDTAYIVAIVILVCIIATIALYRNNSTDSESLPKVSTEHQQNIQEPKAQPDIEEFEEAEFVGEDENKTPEPPKTSKSDRLATLERQLERITQALLKAEKKVKDAQQRLNEIVIKAEADTAAEVEPNTTSAIKNLLYWQNEVERLQYEQENVREKLR